MSYQVLARKWRPRSFEQMVGQNHVLKALVNSLNKQRLHHAYLFTGTRGVGKTSIARLLAKALNCEQGISATPCLQCDICTSIEQGRFVDLIEIDAASRTRVEDTREILENVQYTPTQGRFKIYLIDEVHMLSNHSFNALLKTLEEPPEHVKFLLATTDPQKLPITVLSRCLQFSLKNLLPEQIDSHLSHVLDSEQIPYQQEALTIIAKAASGSMRDALSLLDQAIAYGDDEVKAHAVRDMLGFTQKDYALELLHALSMQDGQQIIDINKELLTAGANHFHVLDELLSHLHHISVLQCVADIALDVAPQLSQLAKTISPEDTQLFYQIGLKGREDISLAPTPAIGFDMVLLRMLTFQPTKAPAKPKQQAPSQQTSTQPAAPKVTVSEAETIPAKAAQPQPAETASVEPPKSEEPEPIAQARPSQPQATPAGPTTPSNDWAEVVGQLKLSGLTQSLAQHAVLKDKQDNVMTFVIEEGHQSMLTPSVTERFEQALSHYYQQTIKALFEHQAQSIASPARQQQQQHQEKQQNATITLENDETLQEIEQRFDGLLIKDSIKYSENEI